MLHSPLLIGLWSSKFNIDHLCDAAVVRQWGSYTAGRRQLPWTISVKKYWWTLRPYFCVGRYSGITLRAESLTGIIASKVLKALFTAAEGGDRDALKLPGNQRSVHRDKRKLIISLDRKAKAATNGIDFRSNAVTNLSIVLWWTLTVNSFMTTISLKGRKGTAKHRSMRIRPVFPNRSKIISAITSTMAVGVIDAPCSHNHEMVTVYIHMSTKLRLNPCTGSRKNCVWWQTVNRI